MSAVAESRNTGSVSDYFGEEVRATIVVALTFMNE